MTHAEFEKKLAVIEEAAKDPTVLAMSQALRAAVRALQLSTTHYECEDGWYSCPKSEDGRLNPDAGSDCTCGADRFEQALAQAYAVMEVKG